MTAVAITYPADERAIWRGCRDYLRSELAGLVAQRRPHKLATRRGEYDQGSLWRERQQVRALHLVYGLLRGQSINVIEAGHEEIVAHQRPYIVQRWNMMKAAGHSLPAPEAIAEWVS